MSEKILDYSKNPYIQLYSILFYVMNVIKHIPKKIISKFIKGIMIVEKPDAFEALFLPAGYPFINVVTSSKICLKKGINTINTNSYLCGQSISNFKMVLPDIERILVVEFHPFSLNYIFNNLASDFFDSQIPLELIDKELSAQLEDLMSSDKSSTIVLPLVENIFRNKIADIHMDSRIIFALNDILRTGGLKRIPVLSQDVNLGTRRFEQVFKKNIGVSPKKYLRIVRFNKLLYDFFNGNNNLNVTNDFFDQAHFVHEMNKMTGMTPSKLKRFMENDINRFSAYNSNLFNKYKAN